MPARTAAAETGVRGKPGAGSEGWWRERLLCVCVCVCVHVIVSIVHTT